MAKISSLRRWLAQLNWKHIRRVERLFEKCVRDDNRALRGIQLANDLVMTRDRAFFKVVGKKALPISLDDVAKKYKLDEMQVEYRIAQERWKQSHRNSA